MSVLLKRWDGSSWVDTEINVWSNITGKPSTYTPTAHTHSATDITSGVLAVAGGGTGNSSVDTTPTSGSTKMVTSGGVYTQLATKLDGLLTSDYLPYASGSKSLANWEPKVNILPTIGIPRTNLGNPSLYELGMIDSEFTNKTDFFPYGHLTIETSSDGTTFVDGGFSDAQKKMLVGGDGQPSLTIPAGGYIRVTFETSSDYVYLNALYLYVTTGGNSLTCKIERSYATDNTNWYTVVDYGDNIGSWPGHVILRHNNIAWHPTATTQSSSGIYNFSKYVRFTIHANGTATSSRLTKCQWWGGYPYGRRNPYSVDADKNYTFPSNVSASSFTEGGTLLSSKYSPLAGSSSITKLGTIVSGSIPYSLITGTPTIPTVNNATLTIKKNGTSVGTFTANASIDSIVNLTLSKSDVGLSNVDNTSDLSKPISTLTQSSLDNKVDDFQLILSWNSSGGIIPIKFITVNYTSATSEAGVFIRLKMRGGHGNGTSYVFLQDTFINVGSTGTVVCNNYKHFGTLNSSVSFDGSYRRYGDIFWVQDTTNKVVDFYVFVGQYSSAACVMTPYQRMNTSTGGVVTQYTGAGVQFSSGTKVYADNGLYVKSDSVTGDVSATSFIEGGTLLSSKYSPIAGSSSLTTCSQGTFGDMATKTASNYLPLSGGTMSGALTVNASITANSITEQGQSLSTKYSPKAGSSSITTLGTIASGTWNGTKIGDSYIADALTGKTYNGYTLAALCELSDTDDIGLGQGAGNACQSYDTLNDLLSSLYNHMQNASNPHGVTASQIGALPLSAGTSNPITGHLMLNGGSSNSSTGTTSQIVMARGTTQQWALSSNDGVFIINPSTSSTTNQFCYYFNTGNIVVPKVNGYTLANGCSLAYSYSSGTLTIT